MSLVPLKDYVTYQNVHFTDRLQPLEHFKVDILATKKCVFIFPKELRGAYVFIQVLSEYDIFEGTPVQEASDKIIKKSNTVEELEESLKKLLNNNEKYVHILKDKRMCKFGSFLGKHTMSISYGKNAFVSLLVNGKSKEFRNFLEM